MKTSAAIEQDLVQLGEELGTHPDPGFEKCSMNFASRPTSRFLQQPRDAPAWSHRGLSLPLSQCRKRS